MLLTIACRAGSLSMLRTSEMSSFTKWAATPGCDGGRRSPRPRRRRRALREPNLFEGRNQSRVVVDLGVLGDLHHHRAVGRRHNVEPAASGVSPDRGNVEVTKLPFGSRLACSTCRLSRGHLKSGTSSPPCRRRGSGGRAAPRRRSESRPRSRPTSRVARFTIALEDRRERLRVDDHSAPRPAFGHADAARTASARESPRRSR